MQKKSKIKAIAMLLTICIVLSLVPAPAWATEAEPSEAESTETEREYTLQDAIAGIVDYTELYDPLDADTVPEVVGYDNALSKNHVQRLYADEGDDLNKVVFLNADGTKTMYIYDYPVKYVDTDGTVKDISLNIADASAGFETDSADAVTTFSRQLSNGIRLNANNTEITMVPILPKTVNTGSVWFNTATVTDVGYSRTAQRVDEKTIEYRYDGRTTIEYSLTYTGFKEDIVVSEYTGQTEYDFRLYTNGLALTEIDGSFYLVDDAGNIKATIGDIIIFTADERNNTFGQLVSTTIVENEEYLLTIVVDADFLSDENTAYPIRIDPTVEINYDSNGTGAIEDVTVHSEATSKGTLGSLYIGLKEGSGVSRALMKFPGLDLSTLGEYAVIQSATLDVRDLMCESTAMDIYCYVFAGSSWTESTANWTNTYAGSNYSISTHLCTVTMDYDIGRNYTNKHWYSFDISAAVRGWQSGYYTQSKGIIFKMSDSHETGSTYTYRTIGSYNRSSNKPTLVMTYRNDSSQKIPNGLQYINNTRTGQYLQHTTSGTLIGKSGLLSNLGNTIQWNMQKVGDGYIIASASSPTKYLGVPETTSSTSVSFVTVTDSAVPARCIWLITYATGGGCIIQNSYNSKYLYFSGNYLFTSSTLATAGTTEYDRYVWRIVPVTYYGNTATHSMRELTEGTTISNIEVLPEQKQSIYVDRALSNELWCKATDFTYTFNKTGIATYEDGTISAGSAPGGAKVTATHKVTGRMISFYVIVGYSTTLPATPFPATITDGLNKPYGIWPAGAESAYYYYSTEERTNGLVGIYAEAVAGVTATKLIYPDASDLLNHYLSNTGTKYTIDFKSMIDECVAAAANRSIHINQLMRAAEAVATYSAKTLRTMNAYGVTTQTDSTNWYLAINNYYVSVSGTCRKTSASSYTMTVTYELHDCYDWERTSVMTFVDLLSSQMWELHYGGYAKNYELYGVNSFTISWTEGQSFSEDLISNEQ